ncbi:MAG TPA: hypothetical protein VHY35_24185 [Stellaceae bacterium]|nr:hypothetical protein [Stellaceae bacterium]
MDHSEDVERLFSWLTAPMVRYRNFTPQAEVAEAVATWPLVHRAAVQSGVKVDAAAPQGSAAAHERVARDQMGLPAAAARALRENPPLGTVTPNPASSVEQPHVTTDSLVAELGNRVHATNAERAEGIAAAMPTEPLPPAPPPVVSAPPAQPAASSVAASQTAQRDTADLPRRNTDEPPVRPEPGRTDTAQPGPVRSRQDWPETAAQVRPDPYRPQPTEPQQQYPAGDRGGLFRGEYRGRDSRPVARSADRQDRSLDAVFGRLSGARERLPDPRARGRTSPGLGSVFNRLR